MSRSNQETVKHRFRWVIDGVTREKLERPGFFLMSDSISIDFNGNKTEWKGFIQQEYEGYLCVAIKKFKFVLDNFSLSLDAALNGVKHLGYNNIKSTELTTNWGWSKFLAFDKLFDPLSEYFRSDSKLELVYDIELFHQNIEDDEEDTPSKNTYTKFFNDTSLADFTLISSDGQSFKVHRTVLADASDYFMKLFTIDMKEKQQGSVKFDDIDSETLKEVLEFIYKGKLFIIGSLTSSKVIYAAEKFNLPGLKKFCCETLKDWLHTDNAITILSIAHMYNEEELEKFSLKIIIGKYEAVKKTEGWKSLTLPLSMKISDASIADSKIPQTTLYSSLHSR